MRRTVRSVRRPVGRVHRLEQLGLGAEARVRVDVGHGDRRVALAQQRHEARRRQAAAAVVEEVGLGRTHLGAEHRGPVIRPAMPPCRTGRSARRRRPCRAAATAAPRGRPCPRSGSAGTRRRRAPGRGRPAAPRAGARAPPSGRSRGADARVGRRGCGVGHDVADEHLAPGARRLDGRGCPRHAGEGLQRRVDLAELDPPTAELDLLVGAPDEDEAFRVVDDEVARAVGARPSRGSAWGRTSRRPWPGRGSGPARRRR